MQFTVESVARVRCPRPAAQDDLWGPVESTIELDNRFDAAALQGLDGFSHLEVVYLFDQVDPAQVNTGARHPRNNPGWPQMGIFAQRARKRPNRIGVSCCSLLGVSGRTIRVRGLDAIDGTPVLDIKPVIAEFLPQGALRQPAWCAELMAQYWVD